MAVSRRVFIGTVGAAAAAALALPPEVVADVRRQLPHWPPSPGDRFTLRIVTPADNFEGVVTVTRVDVDTRLMKMTVTASGIRAAHPNEVKAAVRARPRDPEWGLRPFEVSFTIPVRT